MEHDFLRQYIIPRESIIKNKCISTFCVTEHPLHTKQWEKDVIWIIYKLVYNWKKYYVSHWLVSNRILLICIAVEAKIDSISKVPKSLKGRRSNTICGRHTKFGSDLPDRVLNTNKVLLSFCVLSFCNLGNQYDSKWPLLPKSLKYSNVLNKQITATMF